MECPADGNNLPIINKQTNKRKKEHMFQFLLIRVDFRHFYYSLPRFIYHLNYDPEHLVHPKIISSYFWFPKNLPTVVLFSLPQDFSCATQISFVLFHRFLY